MPIGPMQGRAALDSASVAGELRVIRPPSHGQPCSCNSAGMPGKRARIRAYGRAVDSPGRTAASCALDDRDPLEPKLTAEVSPRRAHGSTSARLQAGSASPAARARHRPSTTSSARSSRTAVEVERREIEAFISLPQEARLALPDGSVDRGAHPLVLDVGRGAGRRARRRRRRPAEDFTRAAGQDRARARPGLAGPGVGAPSRPGRRSGLRPHWITCTT